MQFLIDSTTVLLRGTLVTVELTVTSLFLATAVAIFIALAEVYGNTWLKITATAYERIIRSIPILVIMFIVFFGFPTIGIRFDPFVAAVISLGIRSSAYQSQIFRGALLAVSRGQVLAAKSLGMTGVQTFFHITFPQALRFSIAPLTNEFTIVLKDTSIAYALGVTELLREGTYIVSTTYEPLLIYSMCAAIYFIITFGTNKFIFSVEKKFSIPGYEVRGVERA
ncbi:amino acid ABC transporter permease [Mesoaciditoga lauensis]|uniref:amino acid ABC transporter permease n=1 Tax=Mesoaciditoga lauensis TaxID=1495039 RepID=UPI0005617813|nr:amino acid ABC transporter permease [Mesoaciditoga lauensis]